MFSQDVDLNTTSGRRPSAAVRMTLGAAAVLGVSLWLSRRLDQRLADPRWDRLAKQVRSLMAAHDQLAETIDRRLRSLEESAARAEAEVRFMASLLGEHRGAQSTRETPSTGAAFVERSRSTPARGMLRAASGGIKGSVEGRTP